MCACSVVSLCDPMDCGPPGSSLSVKFPRQEHWSGLPFHPPGDLPGPGVEIYFFRAPVNVDNLTSSYESQIFLMISRLVNPFQKVFNLVCLDPLEESLSAATMYVCLSHV